METVKEKSYDMLDPDWIELLLFAKEIGLTIEQVKEFLDEKSNNYQ